MKQQLEATLQEKKIEFLDLKYCDILGRLRHVTLPIERLKQAAADGMGFDSSSVAGFRTVEAGDMVLKPDLDSSFVDPFAVQPTISCFAAIYDPTTGQRYERDPRYVLERAITSLCRATRADAMMILTEFEFYLFNTVEFYTDDTSSAYKILTDELRHDDQTGLALFKGPAYHVAPPFDRSADFRSELSNLMQGCGIPVKYHHHEGGRFSQVEIEPTYLPALKAADAVVLTKYLVRNLAFRTGRSATFMPKPIYGEPGSGMHVHQFLTRNGASLFGDDRMESRLSDLGRHYIGGLLDHAPSLCALTNPSTNSYRRLTPGFEAPVLVFFSFGNRTAAIRIPGYIRSARKMSLEYRIPDATANPYLSLAAILMAGLEGVRARTDPGFPLKGRIEDSAQSFGAKTVPTSLNLALDALKTDCDYLKHDEVFTQDLIDKWIELKSLDAETVARRPHPWEFNLYYGC
jgi:glutamine synthetase